MQTDSHWLQRCLQLAEQAICHSNPNPAVGAVIVGSDGVLLGEGFTQAAGQPHAEIMALRDAAAKGHAVRGATMYVTLEPCSHHGRTPPCADAIVKAGIARVVACTADPNPLVAGNGFARLQQAGVVVAQGFLQQQAQELNVGFFKRMQHGTPWVRLKAAASLDGFTALPSGESQWITGQTARDDGHHWRARACVVLTGIGTVLADNPTLNVRAIDVPRQPHVAVVDSQLRLPLDARLLDAELMQQRELLLYTTAAAMQQTDKVQQLEQAGVQIIPVKAAQTQKPARQQKSGVNLDDVLQDLAQRLHANEIHVEAGATLNASLLQYGLVDELLYYLAPRMLLAGKPLAAMPAEALPSALNDTLDWRIADIEQLGEDARLLLRPVRPVGTV